MPKGRLIPEALIGNETYGPRGEGFFEDSLSIDPEKLRNFDPDGSKASEVLQDLIEKD